MDVFGRRCHIEPTRECMFLTVQQVDKDANKFLRQIDNTAVFKDVEQKQKFSARLKKKVIATC